MTNDVQGIYQIKNLKNDKVYIGSSKAIYKRWYDHKNYLKKNKHHSGHLQYAWDKYGEESFKFSILEKVEDNSILLDRETYWITSTKSICPEHGYNIDLPKDNQDRIKLQGLKRNTKEVSKLARPIIQVDVETGKIIKRYENISHLKDSINDNPKKLEHFVELNKFKARSDKARILHPYNNTVIMYEELYRPDYDYKAAIKYGELIKVWEGDKYLGQLTVPEIEKKVGKLTDYSRQRLRAKSYKEGKAEFRGLTLEFIRKPLVDNPKEPQLKLKESCGISEGRTEKFSSKGNIVGLREGEVVEKFSSLREMATSLEITYKMSSRLVSNTKRKKKRKGITYVYEKDYLNTV